ncbi:MAG TPA: hypothetical protein VN786_04255, partial [Acidimicrobiales bacterium]|nr:hypothetical protein [Acidimicrobiales bacterium]
RRPPTRQRKRQRAAVMSMTWLVTFSVAVAVGLLTSGIGWALVAAILTAALVVVAGVILLAVQLG